MIETTGTPQLRLGAFALSHLVLPEPKAFAEHWHEQPHLVMVYRGVWTDTSANGAVSVRAGEILFHPARFTHASSAAAPHTELVIIHIDDEVTRAFCPLYGNAPRDVRLSFEAVRGVPERIREELTRRDDAAPVLLESLIMQLLALGSRAPDSTHAVPPSWFATALTFIRQELGSPLPVEAIAAHVGVSRSTLAHVFRDVLGLSVTAYIRERRVRAAASALRETRHSIGEVALACGFYDQAHLNRSFRASRDMTPLEYRRSYRERPAANPAAH